MKKLLVLVVIAVLLVSSTMAVTALENIVKKEKSLWPPI